MNLHLTAADLAVILGPVTGLVGLWLRLSWRTRQERARRRTLVDLAQTLRRGCEFEEHAADGTRLRITVNGVANGQNGFGDLARRAAASVRTPAAGGESSVDGYEP
jgi:hypothetical protein